MTDDRKPYSPDQERADLAARPRGAGGTEMSDIVERLRELSSNCLKLEAAGGNEGAWLQIAGIQKDAAAEIKRLRGLFVEQAAQHEAALIGKDEKIERLRGLLREALDNEAAVSTIGIDSETLQEYRMWDADDWNRRVLEALGE